MDSVVSALATVAAAEAGLRDGPWALTGCLVVMVRASRGGVDANKSIKRREGMFLKQLCVFLPVATCKRAVV